MQLGDLPYVAVDDQAPSMALVGHGPRSQLGPRNCGVTRYMTLTLMFEFLEIKQAF